MGIILYTLLAVIGAAVATLMLHLRRLGAYVKDLAGPKGLPLLGCAHLFIGKNNEEIMSTLVELSQQYSSPAKIFVGPILVVMVDRPEDLQMVLNSPNCLQKPYVYNFFRNRTGLFTAPSEMWKQHRKLLNPTFNLKILQSFFPIFNAKVGLLIKNMGKEIGKGHFDVSRFIFACTLDITCASTLGYEVEVQQDKNQQFLHALGRIAELVNSRIFRMYLHLDFIFYQTKLGKMEDDNFQQFFKLPTAIRAIKKEQFINSKYTQNASNEDSEEFFKTPQIFVNELFKLERAGHLNDSNVKDQVETIIVGGTETSALVGSHALLMLAMHPDVQQKAYEELKEVFPDASSDTTYEQVTRLNYLDLVLKETMRLFPVGPFLGRECTDNVEIRNCTIPKGAVIFLPFYKLHRSVEFWGPNAHKFNPDNFLPENVAQRHPYTYLPFSGGPRNCIGMKYGMLSLKVIISSILRNYRLSTDLTMEELKPKMDITLKLANKPMIKVDHRVF